MNIILHMRDLIKKKLKLVKSRRLLDFILSWEIFINSMPLLIKRINRKFKLFSTIVFRLWTYLLTLFLFLIKRRNQKILITFKKRNYIGTF